MKEPKEKIKVHRCQFIIGPEPVAIHSDWRVFNIRKDLYLSCCNSLNIMHGSDKKGNQFLILGIAVQADENCSNPLTAMCNCSDLLKYAGDVYSSWSGRWIFVNSSELHLDFAGLMGCFYVIMHNELWISSSVALLSSLCWKELPSERRLLTLPAGHMNWFPLPGSSIPGIKALLPSQVLLLDTGRVRPRQIFPQQKFIASESDAINRLQNLLLCSMRNIDNGGGRIFIPLSAGYDSRLLLSAARQAGLPVHTYTIVKKNRWPVLDPRPRTSIVSEADMTLPPLIAAEVHVPHQWIPEKRYSRRLLKIYDQHTSRQTMENDRAYFAKGQWDWVSHKDVILPGQTLGLGSCHYYQRLGATEADFKELIKNVFELRGCSRHLQALSAYFDWVSRCQEVCADLLDWRDRFYLEQRMAGWLSALQQGLDIVPGQRIHLPNCQDFMCALLSLPVSMRAAKKYSQVLISRMAPELLRHPFNPPDSAWASFRNRLITYGQKSVAQAISSLVSRTVG